MRYSFQDYISIKIHKTDLLLTNFIKTKLESYNIAPEQNLILMLLLENDGLTQQQLVIKLNKDKTNIARMAASLEKKGFIRRSESQNDRRSVTLHLTETGKALGDIILPISEEFNEQISNGLSKEELIELERLLTKISQNVQKSQ
ncbi:MarR family winged helix-turn-helix transcriptional regulator [Metabacillus malikii]|uniref:DNA-binding MarR family transcriptional regulator n=1 Tax=Metabacillus malikii TaxID=1504265 RepID=A0ABT9ZBE0_9BACI|nr:MarR family transcriptional regulator [Metabacillus malikii]MDQ0229320.1 DNA-binding MarR family transcriptional regulator [Metabacillus malikii]